MSKTNEWLREGVSRHQVGDVAAAEKLYRRVLEKEPNNADALCLMGVLNFQRGSLGSAALFYKKAIAARPNHAEARNNYSLVLEEQGKTDEAIRGYREALALKPDYVDAHYNLGNALRSQGKLSESEASYRRAISLAPLHPAAVENLALVLREQDKLDEALECSDHAIELRETALAQNNRGAIFRSKGRLDDAVACFRRAIELDPNLAEAHSNLGISLATLEKLDEGESSCRTALELKTDSSIAWSNLGTILHLKSFNEAAMECFVRAIELKPDVADFHNSLGTTLFALKQSDAALNEFKRAAQLDPKHVVALTNMGNICAGMDRIDEAKAAYREVLRLEPKTSMIGFRLDCCLCPLVFFDNAQIEEYRAQLVRSLDRYRDEGLRADANALIAADTRPHFNLPFHGRNDRIVKEKFVETIRPSFDRDFVSDPALAPGDPAFATGKPHVGFLITNRHELAFVKSIGRALGLFSWKELRGTIFCSKTGETALRKELANVPVEYATLPESLAGCAAAVRFAQCDLLYYFEIGTDAPNFLFPFLKTAPIQVNTWGIQVTSGNRDVDYYVSSKLFEPDDGADHYVERLTLLDTMLSYQRRLPAPSKLVPKEAYGLADDRHIYLCFQHLGKFHPDFDPVMAAILRGDPNGEIVATHSNQPETVRKLEARFRSSMPDVAERFRFLPPQRGDNYSSLVQHAEVLLDPFHFGGVNTTYDGLSLGKAIITMPGKYHRSRYTYGCYRMMQMEDCVVHDMDDYAALAVRIATDRDFREAIEAKTRIASEILFENARTAVELEEFLTATIQNARHKK